MKAMTLFFACSFFAISCGTEDSLFLIHDDSLCSEKLNCSATMSVKVKDERGHAITDADVYAVDSEGNLFGHCITTSGGKNHHDETGYHWYDGCDLTDLPLDHPLALNIVVNDIHSFSEVEWELNSVVDPPHFAAIISLDEGQY